LTGSGLPSLSQPRGLAVNPVNPDIVYVGSFGAGVYKSTDAGASWTEAASGMSSSARYVSALAIDPSNPSVLYSGGGDGVYKSTDGAVSWQAANTGIPGYFPTIGELAVSRDGGVVLAARWGSPYQLYRSTDNGGAWTPVSGLPDSTIRAIAFDPDDDTTVYAGPYGFGLYKSTDAGVTWAPSTGLIASFTVDALAIDPLNSGTVYAGMTSSGYGVYKSSDGGATWMDIKGTPQVYALVPDPAHQGTLLAAGSDGVWKTTGPAVTFDAPLDISQTSGMISTMAASAIDANGKLHVVFVGWFVQEGAPDGVASEIYYTNNVAGSFCDPIRLPTAPVPPDYLGFDELYYSKEPAIALDASGNVHVAYYRVEGQLDGAGVLCYTNNTSGSFATPFSNFRFANSHALAQDVTVISIALDGPGNVHIMCDSGAHHTVGSGTSFSELAPLHPAVLTDYWAERPVLRSDRTGGLHAIYFLQNKATYLQTMVYTNNLAGTWSDPVAVLDTGGQFSFATDLAVDAAGNVHVAYRNSNVWYANNIGGAFSAPVSVPAKFMMDIEIGDAGGMFLASKWAGDDQSLGFALFKAGAFVDVSPPADIYPITSSQWAGGWFQADEARRLFHFVYTTGVIDYVQARMCDYALGTRTAAYSVSGGSGTVDLTAFGTCPWSVTATVPWITPTSGSQGAGDATVGYTVAANAGPARAGKLIVGGQTLLISQAGVNLSPTANAGSDQSVKEALSVTLDGRASSDPEGHALTYTWTQTGGPAVTLDDTHAAQPGFAAPLLGADPSAELTFQLVVNDGATSSSPDQILVNVTPHSFADVLPGALFYPYIEAIFAHNITAGCGDGNYCSDMAVNRAQMAVFLEKGLRGWDYSPPAATGVFGDVPPTHWAGGWIERLAADGITAGCGDGNFCPDLAVTRAQMAVFLLKAKHGASYVPPAQAGVFTDVPIGHWAGPWIEQLAAEGITAGCGTGTYCPDVPVTRGQMAVFLTKTFGF